jgi:molybdopterin adenylyltransferase
MKDSGKILSICVGDSKGKRKFSVPSVKIEKNKGIVSDAHGDGGFRQVSFLSKNRIESFKEEISIAIDNGIFGENIITGDIDLIDYPLRAEFLLGDSVRIVTVQHGKVCHDKLCPIGQATGKCIMPELGVFSKVIQSGELKVGDRIIKGREKVFCVGFITVSDKASAGKRKDMTLDVLKEALAGSEFEILDHVIVPDEVESIISEILHMTDFQYMDLVLTSGGTGLSPRDLTPDATSTLIEKEIPGIQELIRAESFKITPYAALSRGVAGIRKRSFVINLPGSPKAVTEAVSIIKPILRHAIEKIQGDMSDCSR